MRIFLDVGAYIGDTAQAVLTSKHNFDKICCFEPQKDLCEGIRNLNENKIVVFEYGLWNQTCSRPLYWIRKDGATMYKDKYDRYKEKFKAAMQFTECSFVKASDWFKNNLAPEDYVVMKINCEGAECDIMDDLFETEEYKKINALMIDFDVKKIPSQRYREHEIKERLKKNKIPAYYIPENPEDYQGGATHRTHYWMDKIL